MLHEWSTDRFLELHGFRVTADERAHLENMHCWRFLIPRFLEPVEDLKAIYCFGAAHGDTIRELVAAFRFRQLPIPPIHAFDSFEGLPDEDPGFEIPSFWTRGAFANTLEDFRSRVGVLELPADRLVVHPGWFADTLDPQDVIEGTLPPALYVDFDADLYRSTRDALEFMFANQLIRPGTLIGYDDWGDTELWRAGESRAHLEMTRRYRIATKPVFAWGEPPLMRVLFRVTEVDGAQPSERPA